MRFKCHKSSKKQIGTKFGELGNISYSMYLLGFPIQQMVISMFGGEMNRVYNILISLPMDICFGFLISKSVNRKKKNKTIEIKHSH
jgi:Predicted acyltransferases